MASSVAGSLSVREVRKVGGGGVDSIVGLGLQWVVGVLLVRVGFGMIARLLHAWAVV